MAQAEDTMHRNVSQKLVTIMIEMNRNGFPSVVDFFDEDEARAISSEEAKRRVVNAAVESGGVIPVSILSFNGALHCNIIHIVPKLAVIERFEPRGNIHDPKHNVEVFVVCKYCMLR